MQRTTLFLLGLLLACSGPKQSSIEETENSIYPPALEKILTKHGSLDTWKKMKSLSYEIVGEEMNEKQMIHLHDRRERIEAANFVTGYDGENIWLETDTTYSGDPVFYHNLMFYFYAMPFVLADEGIIYSEADELSFEDKSYPGIKISYNAGVGMSAQDEYFLHYDPETYQMEWLGYTVTYFSKEKSPDIRWIRYNDWQTLEELILPKSMTWYKSEEGVITEPKGAAEFEKVLISESTFDDSLFKKTKGAVVVEQ
ncbi:MAG: DUF6503 family protein [Reichenbachiella sp.]|uniref:DUF6503 family protein n=4 Tax=Reichenbachiella sp. TaxID=2184521 RepID=UPI003263455B